MPHGHLTAFFLFEVGDAIDLETVGAQIDVTVSARLPPRPATPPYIQYQQPPLTMDAAAIGLADVNGFRVRLKAFDYGVVSVALTRDLPGTWQQLLQEGGQRVAGQLPPVGGGRTTVPGPARPHRCSGPESARGSVPQRGLRGVHDRLERGRGRVGRPVAGRATAWTSTRPCCVVSARRSAARRTKKCSGIAFRTTRDLLVPTWSSALSTTRRRARRECWRSSSSRTPSCSSSGTTIGCSTGSWRAPYASLQRGGWRPTRLGRHYARAARQIYALFIDVNELTDRTENALGIAGVPLRGAHFRAGGRAPRILAVGKATFATS